MRVHLWKLQSYFLIKSARDFVVFFLDHSDNLP